MDAPATPRPREGLDTQDTRDAYHDAAGPLSRVALAFTLLPLWVFTTLPACDLPAHVAVAANLWRLWRHDPRLQYVFHLGPVPYHACYMVLVPAVGLLGPHHGAALALSLWMGALYVALAALRRALRLPAAVAWFYPVIAYGALFFWGFVATLAGLWAVVGCMVGLWRYGQVGRRRYLWLAMGCAVAASLAHVLLLIPVAMAGLAMLVLSPRRHVAAVVAVAAAGLSTLMPLWLSQQKTSATPLKLVFSGPQDLWTMARLYVMPFDGGLGGWGHGLLLLFAAVAAFYGRRAVAPVAMRSRRIFLATFALACLVCYAISPNNAQIGNNSGEGLSWRFLVFVEIAGVMWCATFWPRRRSMNIALGLACVLFCAGLGRFWWQFEHYATPRVQWFEHIEPGHTIWAQGPRPGEFYNDAWPNVATHLDAYYLTAGGAYLSDVFDFNHIPMRPRRAFTADTTEMQLIFGDAPAVGDLTPWSRCGEWTLYGRGPQPSWAHRLAIEHPCKEGS